ncbi:MAG: SpoIIE family protein phosphatase [Planctomycetes bacterium]|nr:SpoIIE family protein phosphatase [Planctomycetota bacterium]
MHRVPSTTTLVSADAAWIDGLCRRFSRATGWCLEFDRDDAGGRAHIAAADEVWRAAVHDGREPRGFLRLRGDVGRAESRTGRALRDLIDLLAELLSRTLAAGESLASQSSHVGTLLSLGVSLGGEQELPSAVGHLLAAAVELTGFESAAFLLLDRDGCSLHLRACSRIAAETIASPSRNLLDDPPDLDALARGRTRILRADARAAEWLPDGALGGSCQCVATSEGPIGTLWCFDRRTRVPAGELSVLEAIAAQMGAALERMALRCESANGQRLRHDVRVASKSQERPGAETAAACIGLDVASICGSRYELGGDLCDFVPLDGRRLLVAVGDASGDSVPAALVMSAVRGALWMLEASPPENDRPLCKQLVARLNRMLCRLTAPHQFMSLVAGVIDVDRHTFTYTNGGHPAPLLIAGGEPIALQSHGLLLGVADDVTYGSSEIGFGPGEALVLYSDGISEARDAANRLFGEDGIAAAVCGARSAASSAELLAAIQRSVERHTAGGPAGDDRTLAVVQYDL